jgi:hypothetical protein
VTEEISELQLAARALQLAARALQLVFKYCYPFPEEAELLCNSKVKNGMHVADTDFYWISMWIAAIVRSAKEIRSCLRNLMRCVMCSRTLSTTDRAYVDWT